MTELGNKHECLTCSTKFYDIGKSELICPKCGGNQKELAEADEANKNKEKQQKKKKVKAKAEAKEKKEKKEKKAKKAKELASDEKKAVDGDKKK